MNLKTATVIFVVLALGLFTGLSALLVRTVDLLDLEARKLVMAGESIRVAEEVKSRLLVHNRNGFLFSLDKDPGRLESRRDQRMQVMSLLTTVDQLVDSIEEEAVLTDVRREIENYFEQRRELSALGISPVEQYTRISQNIDDTLAVVDRLIEVNREQMIGLMKHIARQNLVADVITVLLLSLGGMVLLGTIVVIVFSVSRPLASMAEAISKYGAGENATRAEVKGVKEIRVIGATFNSMANRLEERRQEQLRVIASIAHDLRNPLNSMSLVSELLATKCEEEDKAAVQILLRQVRSLDRLVSDLLDTSRIEAGQLDLEIIDQDMGVLIWDAVELFRAGTDLHDFKVEVPDEPIVCRCDGRRIAQVINNLVSNAVKYSPNGGVVTIKAWKGEGRFFISVTDQGIGIAPQEIDNIFKPFYRTKATKGTIPGIGLGLSASRRIVEAHGGKLQVKSTPGKGSTFCVDLPLTVASGSA